MRCELSGKSHKKLLAVAASGEQAWEPGRKGDFLFITHSLGLFELVTVRCSCKVLP